MYQWTVLSKATVDKIYWYSKCWLKIKI